MVPVGDGIHARGAAGPGLPARCYPLQVVHIGELLLVVSTVSIRSLKLVFDYMDS
jgi:hypothetical protein